MSFVHLHCRSAYSLFEGTATPKALVAQARKLGMSAIGVTDRANLYGAVPFYLSALKAGIKPIIGMEVDLTGGSALVLLARNMDGYRNLCHLASILRLNAPPETFPPAGFDEEDEDDAPVLPWDTGVWGVPTFGFTPTPPRQSRQRPATQPHLAASYAYTAHGLKLPRELLLSGRHTRGLIALSGGTRGLVNSLVMQGKSRQAARAAGMLLSAFGEGNFFIELTPQDQPYLPALASLAAELNIPIVATNDVLYLKPEDAPVAEALARAGGMRNVEFGMRNNHENMRIDDNESPRADIPNSEFHIPHSLVSAEEMGAFFKDYPQAIANAGYIAGCCDLELPMHKPLFPSVDLQSGENPYSRLWKLCFAGATRHFKPLNDEVISRLKHELEIIESLGFSPYFLIVHDIARFARRQGIPIMARGSAANSLVAYVLDITQVDPLANDLLFERFLSPSRAEFELPDIDLDLCWRRRDEVLHYVYRKYGADHVAIVGTHITFRLRSAWREMAKALQIPLHRINRIASHLPHLPIEDPDDPEGLVGDDEGWATTDGRRPTTDDDSIRNPQSAIRNSLGPQSTQERKALELARAIEGLPRHAGMHCAGVVISPQSTPIADLVPLQRAARDPSLSITQYDKDAIEAMGLVKMDLLGSRALTTLVDTMHSSGLAGAEGTRSGGDLQKTFALIPFDDERTYNMMAQGETLGCFQLESPGMRGLLKWLRPHNLNDVASAVSLFRPGPLEGGFLELFMCRHLRQEALSYVHPAMEPILRDTYGVILYQEQFLKLANSLAGLSLGEAEKLRKELGKTHTPEERARLGTQFVAGAIESGIDQLQAEQVWEIIAGYSGFGFCKAHACSYALTAYRSAYMKAHYPSYFLAAQINNGGGYYGPSVYVEEARRLGITLLVPHVNESNAMCEVIANGRAIRFGLQFVKGLSLNTISLILAERRAAGPFYSLQDLLMRVEMTPSEAASLVKVGACDQLEGGENRRQMMHILPSLITARRPRASRYGIASQAQPRPEAGSTGPLQMVLGDFLPGLMVSPNPRILGDLRFQPQTPFMEEYSPQEKLTLEREALGFTLTCNPMELHPQFIKEHDVVLCRDLHSQANKRVTVAGVAVAGRTHRTKAGEQMLFMSVQDTTGLIELVFFPEAYKQHAATLANNGVGPYLVTGQVQVSGRGRGIGVQPPADFTPADIATIKMHPVVIAETLRPVESPEAALLSSA